MKNIKAALLLALSTALLSPVASFARGSHHSYHSHGGFHYRGSGRESHSIEHVHGYYRSNGTYVHGYDRTRANGTQMDNWSTKGNTNLETGKPGTVTPTH